MCFELKRQGLKGWLHLCLASQLQQPPSSSKPYGYYEDEEALVKRIKQLHRKPRGGKRLGPYQIARILNKEGWKTRNAQEWYGSHVSAILKRF